MSDRGAVAVLPDLHAFQNRAGDIAVVRDRHTRRGADTERDDADAVVLPFADEIADQLLRHAEPVARFEILGGHAPGRIERDDDVDAEAVVRGHLRHALRPRQRHDHRQRRDRFEQERDSGELRAQTRFRRCN